VPTPDSLAALEAAYLAARNARDRLDVARVTGDPPDTASLEAEAARAIGEVRAGLDAIDAPGAGDPAPDEADRRAIEAMRAGIEAADAYLLPGAPADDPAERAAAGVEDDADDLDTLARRLEGAYAAAATALPFDGAVLSRRQVLMRLASEPGPERRRDLFVALEPLWRAVDGDGGPGSPYRELIERSAERWRTGASPVAANARALGVAADDIEAWAVETLAAWRRAVVAPALAAGRLPIEPWDWWWIAGEAHRGLSPSIPPGVGLEITRAVYASLGADPDALGIRFDLAPHAGRAPVPVAFATFDGRPHRRPDGSWSTGHPTILATCTEGGLDELTELVHETGHAIHIAGIRTRPAFADWPDSNALTEALAELVALDLVEPAWQRRWLPGSPEVPAAIAVRSRYAEIAMDAAWALLEIRLHAQPDRVANEVWADITSTWLGIAPHPEWSWWAIRGQLVEAPGYMANYAIGAVLAADLRAAIRAARGDWTDGDEGWYAWVTDHLYRFGLERSSRDVLRDLLGRPPNADALLAELDRATPG
jgi:hypothetical protein